jgi:hypothetical protein
VNVQDGLSTALANDLPAYYVPAKKFFFKISSCLLPSLLEDRGFAFGDYHNQTGTDGRVEKVGVMGACIRILEILKGEKKIKIG